MVAFLSDISVQLAIPCSYHWNHWIFLRQLFPPNFRGIVDNTSWSWGILNLLNFLFFLASYSSYNWFLCFLSFFFLTYTCWVFYIIKSFSKSFDNGKIVLSDSITLYILANVYNVGLKTYSYKYSKLWYSW